MVGNVSPNQSAAETVWLVLDDAWEFDESSSFELPKRVEALRSGPSLRYITSQRIIERFYAEFGEAFRPFILSGSGDFHHLTAIFIRHIKEPFVILSFDNHPDWVVGPVHWSCGGWVNRALENPLVQQVAVWGCGNFECRFPWRLRGNRSACRSGRLWVAPWRSEKNDYPDWLHPMSTADWQTAFVRFAESIRTSAIYVTVDLDCLAESDAITNWESGRFLLADLHWAINFLREKTKIVGGDLCGAFSPIRYASWFQSIAGRLDHPRQRYVTDRKRRSINLCALEVIWPILTQAA
jgi:hypothetical protein